MKNESEFSTGWTICSGCAAQAKVDFYHRVKTGETLKNKEPRVKKKKLKSSNRPEGAIHKRCPCCNTHLWVVQTEEKMVCWKCRSNLKITQALRDSTYHRHGVILSVIE